MKSASDVYKLWPSVAEMAKDLNESPLGLLKLRAAGLIPDGHDQMILTRAVFEGINISLDDLRAIRDSSNKQERVEERRDAIRGFYEAAGGTTILSRRLKTTVQVLRVWLYRAKFPRPLKFEIMEVAKAIDHDIDEELFEAIT